MDPTPKTLKIWYPPPEYTVNYRAKYPPYKKSCKIFMFFSCKGQLRPKEMYIIASKKMQGYCIGILLPKFQTDLYLNKLRFKTSKRKFGKVLGSLLRPMPIDAISKIIAKSSVSDPYHFDADPRIRFWDDGSGSGSGSGSDLKSNKFQLFLLNFFCIKFKTQRCFFVVILSLLFAYIKQNQ